MDGSTPLRIPRRQVLLFLSAILVPCGLLIGLGLRMMATERELEERRLASDRELLVKRISQELLSELERIKFQQMDRAARGAIGTNPQEPVAFVGALDQGRLLLPWEQTPAAVAFAAALEGGAYAERIREAERLESTAHQYDAAARAYRAAIDVAQDAAQKAYARLLLGRAFRAAGRQREARAELERLLDVGPDLVDQDNVPIGLFAVHALSEAGAKNDALVTWVRRAVEGDQILSRVALGIARDIAIAQGADDLAGTLNPLVQARDQAEAIQRDFATLIRPGPGRESIWCAYGDPAWLTSVTPPAGTYDGLVVAVRADHVLKRLGESGGPVRLAAASDATGQTLGDTFPDLRVVLPAAGVRATGSNRPVLAAGLLVAVALIIVAGALLWRDVQRDRRLSEVRSQFVSSVSHELRTPLAAIRMFTETLKLDEELDGKTRSEYLNTVLHESERLSRLVDNVLDFGKIERGQKTYRFKPVRLDEIVGHAARTAQYPLERAGFTLTLVLEPDVPAIAGDSDALEQAVLNLLSNAMKYSGDSRAIDLRLDRLNGHARIHVVDRGTGIAPDDQKRVFDRFYRTASAENQHIPGTGLGLTIVDHIAKAHGGGVEIHSSRGRGSAFTISLPLERPASA